MKKYSGRASKAFWGRIEALPEGDTHEMVYMLGVTLQDLELRVLQVLELAEASAHVAMLRFETVVSPTTSTIMIGDYTS